MGQINYDKMRPCVRKCLHEGLREKLPHFIGTIYENDKDENGKENPLACLQKLPRELFRERRKKMTFAIIHDLNRIGCNEAEIKGELLSWNEKCLPSLSPGDARRQLLGYVDWMSKRDCKLSCKGLADFCLFPEGSGCVYQKRPDFEPLNYASGQARIYLERNYPLYGNGYRMASVLEAIRERSEQTGHNPIFIGLREISSIVYKNRNFRIEPKAVLKDIHELSNERFLEITAKGTRGTTGFRSANGYKLLQWTDQQRIITY